MNNQKNPILPGCRVLVFDPSLFIDDVKTPLSHTLKTAVVIKRYGYISKFIERKYGREAAKYPDCVDVIFDYNNKKSCGHFTSVVRKYRYKL
jgi:hypothetical protein